MKKTVKYTLGYSLSGGGVKGLAHAGALKALEEYGLRPQVISGTSAGAIAAVMYSAGMKPAEILKVFKSRAFNDFVAPTLPTSGFLSLEKFQKLLQTLIPYANLEDLPIPVRILASDLDHGKSVVFDSGSLPERVAASASVPIVFMPTRIDGVYYVDGGVFRNFPVKEIRKDCARVVGINVSPLVPDNYKRNFLGIADRAYNFMFRANTLEDRKLCDVLVETPSALQFGTFDMRKLDDLFNLGYQAMMEQLERLDASFFERE
ncbi:MAG: patatin-like phospholipase family protein [Paludibacteraceae bacterium]|nr:patatin-like phospholipase family protein [Paludibacteraceae bacterium]